MKIILLCIIIDLFINLILTIIDIISKIKYKKFENKMLEEMRNGSNNK